MFLQYIYTRYKWYNTVLAVCINSVIFKIGLVTFLAFIYGKLLTHICQVRYDWIFPETGRSVHFYMGITSIHRWAQLYKNVFLLSLYLQIPRSLWEWNYQQTPCCQQVLHNSFCYYDFERADDISGLLHLSGKTPYCQISWSLENRRIGFRIFQSLWNLTGT